MAKKKKATNEQIVQEVLNNAGLNWEVKKVPLMVSPIKIDGAEPTDYQHIKSSLVQSRNYATYRTDNAEVIGSGSENWNIIQNKELAEFVVTAGNNLLEADNFRGGAMKGGQLVYIQAQLPKTYIGKSDINRNLTALNSHSAGRCLGFGHTNTVVVCENTFATAMKSAGVTKFKHSAELSEQLAEAATLLQGAIDREAKLMELLTASAEVDYTEAAKAKMVNALFGYDVLADTDGAMFDALNTKQQNRLIAFDDALTTSMEEQGGTMYALFNGVTRYTNHVMNASEASLMEGRASALNAKGVTTLESILQDCGVAVS